LRIWRRSYLASNSRAIASAAASGLVTFETTNAASAIAPATSQNHGCHHGNGIGKNRNRIAVMAIVTTVCQLNSAFVSTAPVTRLDTPPRSSAIHPSSPYPILYTRDTEFGCRNGDVL